VLERMALWRARCTLTASTGKVLGVQGVAGLANVVRARGSAVHRRVKGCTRKLLDMMKVQEEEQRGRGQVDVFGLGMVKKRCFPHFNRHEQVHALMQGLQRGVMITKRKGFRSGTKG
jgi:hypothetical protein